MTRSSGDVSTTGSISRPSKRSTGFWLPRFQKHRETLARQICAFTQGLRELDLFKSPGMAETLDWAQALMALGAEQLHLKRLTTRWV